MNISTVYHMHGPVVRTPRETRLTYYPSNSYHLDESAEDQLADGKTYSELRVLEPRGRIHSITGGTRISSDEFRRIGTLYDRQRLTKRKAKDIGNPSKYHANEPHKR